jgi:hypothetical protein
MPRASDHRPSVRLTAEVTAWLDTYAAARPRWADADEPAAVRDLVLARAHRVTAEHPDVAAAALVGLVARETGLPESEVAAALSR